MSENPRDTHFSGFAKLLYEEIRQKAIDEAIHDRHDERVNQWDGMVTTLIAERAYDLVSHALEHAYTHAIVYYSPQEATEQIPDLTRWPEGT